MLSGPLTSDHNFSEGSFFTELIQGESLVIRILIFKENYASVKLKINRVVHG